MKAVNNLKIILPLTKAFFSLLLTFITILFFTKITMNLKPIYYYDALNLNIIEEYNLHIEKYTPDTEYLNSISLKTNYNYIINYIQNPRKEVFKLPTIPFSLNGKRHFEDVKNTITYSEYIFISSIILFILVSLISKKNYVLFCLKSSGKQLIIISIFSLFISFFGFSELFDSFHKIIFKNDYWIFDPQYDPVILILPENYFMHCAAVILFFSLLAGILFYIKGK
ncbi:TIGR01906 family membrane protein [Clostridium neuense]|uniref:TIGR01906 family membrane protein n=1 Tax=Clostridium neuense TaxID=1728934 RepID=A0ABW8TKC3_9CLOT